MSEIDMIADEIARFMANRLYVQFRVPNGWPDGRTGDDMWYFESVDSDSGNIVIRFKFGSTLSLVGPISIVRGLSPKYGLDTYDDMLGLDVQGRVELVAGDPPYLSQQPPGMVVFYTPNAFAIAQWK